MQRVVKKLSMGLSSPAPKPQTPKRCSTTSSSKQTTPRSGRGPAQSIGSARGPLPLDESKKTQALQRLAVGAARSAAAAVQRKSAADRAVDSSATGTSAPTRCGAVEQTQQRKLSAGNKQATLIYGGRSCAGARSAQLQPSRAAAAAVVRCPEGKPKVKPRSYTVYAKQTGRKTCKKPTADENMILDLDISVPIGPVQVVTKPRRAYNTNERFFVPLSTFKVAAPRDFQLLRPAGERYIIKLHRCKAEQARQKAAMQSLVTATRPLLPEWLPLEPMLLPPPPPQFADDDAGDNVWKYRMQRNDTVTLCNFPTWERQLLVREYAGHLPVKYPPM